MSASWRWAQRLQYTLLQKMTNPNYEPMNLELGNYSDVTRLVAKLHPKVGTCTFIASDMVEQIRYAASVLPQVTTVLEPSDIPMQHGMAWFETDLFDPMPLNDGFIKPCALSWTVAENKLLVVIWAAAAGHVLPVMFRTLALNQPQFRSDQADINPEYCVGPERAEEQKQFEEIARVQWDTINAFFLLIGQRVPTTHNVQKKKHRKPGPINTVKVYTLRRSHSSNQVTGNKANYSHRFVVSGHWRMQPYKSLGCVKPLWIEEHIKGDPDKPLIIKERVAQVVR